MRASKSQSYHHGDLRRALVDGAARLIARRRGVEFTLRELAGAAKVSHAATYRHFTNKTDILAAVAEVGFGRLHADFARASAEHCQDPRAELHALGLAYVRFALAHEGFYRVMFHPELGDRVAYPGLMKEGDNAFASLLSAVTRGVEQGVFLPRPPLALALFAWSAVHGLSSLLIDGLLHAEGDANGSLSQPEQLSALVVDCVMRGVVL